MNESETTNYQLARACKKYKIPLRLICFKDQLVEHKPLAGGYILNLADNGEQGTHWVALWICPKDEAVYFDSFGMPPPNEVREFIKRADRDLTSNQQQLQSIRSGFCGQYCVNFLYNMTSSRGKSVEDRFLKFLKNFNPVRDWNF